MNDQQLLDEYLHFLCQFGISPKISSLGNNGKEISVLSKDYLKFGKIIGSLHPRKQKIIIRNLEKGPSHPVFIGLKNENVCNNFFDLSKIPNIRAYGLGNYLKSLRSELGVCRSKLATILRKSIATVDRWERNKTGIPLETLLQIGKMAGKDKLEVYREISKLDKILWGFEKTQPIDLPLKIKKEVVELGKMVRATQFGIIILHRAKMNLSKLISLIDNLFGKKVVYNKWSQSHIINHILLSRFFKTFFIYGLPWQPLDSKEAELLKQTWDSSLKYPSIKSF